MIVTWYYFYDYFHCCYYYNCITNKTGESHNTHFRSCVCLFYFLFRHAIVILCQKSLRRLMPKNYSAILLFENWDFWAASRNRARKIRHVVPMWKIFVKIRNWRNSSVNFADTWKKNFEMNTNFVNTPALIRFVIWFTPGTHVFTRMEGSSSSPEIRKSSFTPKRANAKPAGLLARVSNNYKIQSFDHITDRNVPECADRTIILETIETRVGLEFKFPRKNGTLLGRDSKIVGNGGIPNDLERSTNLDGLTRSTNTKFTFTVVGNSLHFIFGQMKMNKREANIIIEI